MPLPRPVRPTAAPSVRPSNAKAAPPAEAAPVAAAAGAAAPAGAATVEARVGRAALQKLEVSVGWSK